MSRGLAGLTLGVTTLVPNRNNFNSVPVRFEISSKVHLPKPHNGLESSQVASDSSGDADCSETASLSTLHGSVGKSVSDLSACSALESGKSWPGSSGSSSSSSSFTCSSGSTVLGSTDVLVASSDGSCLLQNRKPEAELSGQDPPGSSRSESIGCSSLRNGRCISEQGSSVVLVGDRKPPISKSSSQDFDSYRNTDEPDHHPKPPQLSSKKMVVGDHFRGHQSPSPPDLHVKLILLGDYSVGKSSLLRVLARQSRQLSQQGEKWGLGDPTTTSSRSLSQSIVSKRSSLRPSVMSPLWEEGNWVLVRSCLQPGEYVEVEFLHHDKRVLTRVADTGGQERYRSMTTSYYRGAHGCLLMFDVTKEESFSNLDTWIENIDRYKTVEEFPCILVGTRCKSPARRIPFERATEFAESRGFHYMELDMDHMTDIRRVFEALLDSVTVRLHKPAPIAINIRPDISASKDVLMQKTFACSC